MTTYIAIMTTMACVHLCMSKKDMSSSIAHQCIAMENLSNSMALVFFTLADVLLLCLGSTDFHVIIVSLIYYTCVESIDL